MMMMLRNSGNFLRLSPFRYRFHSQLFSPNYSVVVNDPRLFLNSVREKIRLGFSGIDIPVSIFHQLNSLRPRPSIIIFTQLFTAMSKIKPHPPFSTVITLFHQLELSGLRPDMRSIGCSPSERTYNTIIKGSLRANDIAMALDYLHTMRSEGFAADADTSSLFIGLLTSSHVSNKDKALLQKYFLENKGEEKENE